VHEIANDHQHAAVTDDVNHSARAEGRSDMNEPRASERLSPDIVVGGKTS
jgi:hypothetical protein